MLKEPESFLNKLGHAFWSKWEKIWWLIALAFLGANYLAGRQFGWLVLLRFWSAAWAISGAFILIYSWRALGRARESLNWLGVEAQIIASAVETREERIADSISGQPDYITYYYPRIEYEYVWAGFTYRSHRLLFINVNYSRAEAEQAVARYPVGGLALAYVCPDNPRLAVLEPGWAGKGGKYGKTFLIGLIFLAIGSASWFLLPIWLK